MAGNMARPLDQTEPAQRDAGAGAPRDRMVLFGKPLPIRERLNIGRVWPWLFLIVVALLFLRQPYALIRPTFYAEDGNIFFKQQYEMGFAPALATPYNGYLHLAPRIIAAVCSWLPVECIPAAYAVISLFATAAIFVFFFASGFRQTINSDFLRAVVVVLFALMPNPEPLMKVAYINWPLLFFVATLTVFSLPKQQAARWLLLIPAAIAAWSNPATIICAPVMLYRAWKAGDAGEKVWWAFLTLVAVSFPFAMERQPSQMALLLHERSWSVALVHALGYRVFCFFFFGSMLTYPWRWEGWMLVDGVSLVLGVFTAVVVVRTALKAKKSGKSGALPPILFYLVLALPALFVFRREWQLFFLSWGLDAWQGSDRYFFSSTLLLCVLFGVAYETVYSPWMKQRKRRRELSLLLFVFWLLFQGFGFRMADWHAEKPWVDNARRIHDAEASARRTGKYEIVHVESTPPGFDFDLMVNATAARRTN
jgi:hypothetical protein